MVRFISLGCGNIARVLLALGRYSRNLTIDLDASHYLYHGALIEVYYVNIKIRN